jgi:hypothetical protein
MTMRRVRGRESLAEQIAGISSLHRAALVARWTRAYGRPPLAGLSRRLLEYAAVYHVQSEAFGGLKPEVRRRLQRQTVSERNGGPPTKRSNVTTSLPPGSRLVREWRGRTYSVEVLETGVLCDGRHYGSLSEVARAITGARWSGPRFFGL